MVRRKKETRLNEFTDKVSITVDNQTGHHVIKCYEQDMMTKNDILFSLVPTDNRITYGGLHFIVDDYESKPTSSGLIDLFMYCHSA